MAVATILNYNRPFGYEKSANGYCLKTHLSKAWVRQED